jgi:hypothetical protein
MGPRGFPLIDTADWKGREIPSDDPILVAAVDVLVAKIMGPLLFLNIEGDRHLLPHSYSFIS